MLLFQLLTAVLGGWLRREQAGTIAFLPEENRIVKARLGGPRLLASILIPSAVVLALPGLVARQERELADRRDWAQHNGRHPQRTSAMSGAALEADQWVTFIFGSIWSRTPARIVGHEAA